MSANSDKVNHHRARLEGARATHAQLLATNLPAATAQVAAMVAVLADAVAALVEIEAERQGP
jgi:hypothetical protein